MDSGKESPHSTTDHQSDDIPPHVLRAVVEGEIHKQILFRSVRFWSVFYRNDSRGSGGAPPTQFTGERSAYNVVDDAS